MPNFPTFNPFCPFMFGTTKHPGSIGLMCEKLSKVLLTEYDLENDNVQSALNRTIGSYGPKQVECPGGFYRNAKGKLMQLFR